ncbi:MAG: peptidylprolyl isomerase [Acidobacteriota bacterium]
MQREVFRHPAVHVIALGVIVAAAFLIAKGPPTADEARRVVLTGGDILQLKASFMRTWQREPTATELRGALEQHIRQEILYREALARGYDRDDLVVRRAMQRKMEFLAASQALQEPPSDEEIQAYFSLRQERYRLPTVVSFAQVFVSPERRGADAEQHATEILARLRAEDPEPNALASWGDPIMLESYYAMQTEKEVSAAFGGDFSAAVVALEPGQWEGPVQSGYGLHLVKVVLREDSRIPEWTEVSGRIINDMEFEARNSAKDQLYQEIAQKYEVVLDGTAREVLESTE